MRDRRLHNAALRELARVRLAICRLSKQGDAQTLKELQEDQRCYSQVVEEEAA